jgi:Rhodopirellula transposase DDE domain
MGPSQAGRTGAPTWCRPTPRRKKSPRVLKVLAELLQDATAGDPISGLKWTHRSLRKLGQALRRRGITLTPPTLARLLRQLDVSLRTNRKRLAGIRDPDRDRQFR